MTALAGLWSRRSGTPETAVGQMLDAQAIYGPDPAVRRTLGPTSLGRRLFPLLVEDALDRGPVMGGDRTLLLVADARIDNRGELAERLGYSALELCRLPEPEIVMAVIERWGIDGLAHVVGPYAVILWNERTQVLTLARDPLGERPLHIHRGDGFVAVASMPRGLHALRDIPYKADEAAAAGFLSLLPESSSFFAGIQCVRPGHALTLTADGGVERRLWTPDPTPLRLKSSDYEEGLRDQLDLAVACRVQRTDGAIGAQMSGGLDSTAVAATAARQLAPKPLHAFTAVPGTPTEVPATSLGDEGPLAAAVAAMHPNMLHTLVRGTGASPMGLLDRHFDLYQRPVLNPWNAVWGEAINDAARARGVRVLLTGGLGNFTLSHDGSTHLPALLRGGRLFAFARLATQLSRRGWTGRRLAATALGPFLSPAIWEALSARFSRSWAMETYSPLRSEAVLAHDIAGRATASGTDLSYRPWPDGRAMRLWGIGRVDLGNYVKGTLAGWGIDLSDPTADRRLIEWGLRVPEEQYILHGEPRSLARRALADRLPRALLDETRRGYQAADWHVGAAAAQADVRHELDSLSRCSEADALIDIDRLQTLLADWPDFAPEDRRWNQAGVTDRYRSTIFRGMATGHFLRRVARTN